MPHTIKKRNPPLIGKMINRFRHIIRLTVLALLMTAGFLPNEMQAAPRLTDQSVLSHTLEATHNDSPTWESLGLEDLLTPPNECSVSAPQSAPAHSGGSAHRGAENPAAAQPMPATRRLHREVPRPARSNDYYLYFLYRLRL